MQLIPSREPISLDRFAYDSIKEAILTFRVRPGQTLLESELADQLKISKTPVRSALLQLENEGLIIKSHYKGAVVAELSAQKMIEVFEVRSTLEGLAARLAAEKISEDRLLALEQIVAEEQKALKSHNIDLASELNVRFHRVLIETASNEWLARFLSILDDHLRRYRILSNYQKGRLDKSVLEHGRILQALKARDGDQAEAVMKAHLLSVMNDLDHDDIQNLIENLDQAKQEAQ